MSIQMRLLGSCAIIVHAFAPSHSYFVTFQAFHLTAFGIIFLCVLILATAARLWLGARHVAYVHAHREAVPAQFAAEVSLAAHQKAADYTCAKTRLALVSVVVEAALVLWLTLGGGVQRLYDMASRWFDGDIARGLALITLVSIVTTVDRAAFRPLPHVPHRGALRLQQDDARALLDRFREERRARRAFRSAARGVRAVAHAGRRRLLVAVRVVVWVVFNLFMLAIYPTWIAPLFNRFSPMQDPEMKERVEKLLARCGFKVKGLMVMDGSRRSSHGNAYFTGFGRSKRIVFFDTLLTRLTPPEVEAVLAHELGHFSLRHVVKRIVWIFAAASLSVAARFRHAPGLVLRGPQRRGALDRGRARAVLPGRAELHVPAAAAAFQLFAQARVRSRPLRRAKRVGAAISYRRS